MCCRADTCSTASCKLNLLEVATKAYVLAGLKALGTSIEDVPLTLTVECCGDVAMQPAVDDAAPVPPLEYLLLVEPSTVPTSLQLLLGGSPLRQARSRIMPASGCIPRHQTTELPVPALLSRLVRSAC